MGANMFHVVFQHADTEVLKKAMELDESLAGDILQIKDDFAVGPLQDVNTEEGWAARANWWKSLLDSSPYAAAQLWASIDDRKTVEEIVRRLEQADEDVWIWMGQNQHDVCGYYWLVSHLTRYHDIVTVLYLNNLPFINEKGQIFYPTTLHEIQPGEFLKAKKLRRKVTMSEFEIDPDEWKKLCAENALVRILEGGKKIVSKSEDFFDKDILNGLTNEWQKGNRAMQNILGKMKIKTGDVYLLWRIRNLVDEGKLEIKGDPAKGWKEFEIRTPSATPEITQTNPD